MCCRYILQCEAVYSTATAHQIRPGVIAPTSVSAVPLSNHSIQVHPTSSNGPSSGPARHESGQVRRRFNPWWRKKEILPTPI
jgi:hypothetical protein